MSPGVELTGGVVPKVQHLPHPDHHHPELGVPGSRLQGTALSRAQGLLRTGLYHEDIVLPKVAQILLKEIRKAHFISGSTVSVINPLAVRVSVPVNLCLQDGQQLCGLSLNVDPAHEVEDETGGQKEDQYWPGYHGYMVFFIFIFDWCHPLQEIKALCNY